MRKTTETGAIREYHAHVHFKVGNREEAARLRAWVEERFEVCMEVSEFLCVRRCPVSPNIGRTTVSEG
jgi:aromatic ring-cleaving dioxygenase